LVIFESSATGAGLPSFFVTGASVTAANSGFSNRNPSGGSDRRTDCGKP
jgi:hypothetical protein